MGIRRGKYQPVLQLPANALATPETNGAPLSRNLDIPVRLFDDTTSEYVQGSFLLPQNYNPVGQVIVTAAVEAATPAAANVAYSLYYKVIGDGTSGPSGSIADPWASQGTVVPHALDDTSGKIHFHQQEHAALPWSPGALVIFRFGRNNSVGSNLVDDLRLYHLIIEVPVG